MFELETLILFIFVHCCVHKSVAGQFVNFPLMIEKIFWKQKTVCYKKEFRNHNRAQRELRIIWGKQWSLLQRAETCCLWRPNFKKTWWVELVTNLLTPTSTPNVGCQGLVFELLSTWGKYLLCFLIFAASMPSSTG